VAVGTCENLQLEITVAVLLRLRVQGIASDDDGGGVGGGAAGLGDAATGGYLVVCFSIKVRTGETW
jgi:hypothetical protein